MNLFLLQGLQISRSFNSVSTSMDNKAVCPLSSHPSCVFSPAGPECQSQVAQRKLGGTGREQRPLVELVTQINNKDSTEQTHYTLVTVVEAKPWQLTNHAVLKIDYEHVMSISFHFFAGCRKSTVHCRNVRHTYCTLQSSTIQYFEIPQPLDLHVKLQVLDKKN